jgi:cell division protein ZapA
MTTTASSAAVTVHILDKEYRVACPPDEQEALLRSASYLSKKMKEIRDSGKVIGTDRIAVMAALNLANDLLKSRSESESHSSTLSGRIKTLQNKIDAALHDAKQLDL